MPPVCQVGTTAPPDFYFPAGIMFHRFQQTRKSARKKHVHLNSRHTCSVAAKSCSYYYMRIITEMVGPTPDILFSDQIFRINKLFWCDLDSLLQLKLHQIMLRMVYAVDEIAFIKAPVTGLIDH